MSRIRSKPESLVPSVAAWVAFVAHVVCGLVSVDARAAPAPPLEGSAEGTTANARLVRFDGPPPWVTSSESPDVSAGSEQSGGGVRYLLFDRQVRVGSSATERYSHFSQQIANESGLQSASRIDIEFDPTFETLVLHSVTVRRGDQRFDRLDRSAIRLVQRERNLEAQLYDGRRSAILFVSDLRVGDIVDYEFTIRGDDPTLEGKFVDAVLLGVDEPVVRLRQRVLLPAARHVRVALRGPGEATDDMHPEEHGRDGTTELVWDRRDVPAYRIEVGAPSSWDGTPYAEVSEFATWHDVALWGTHLFRDVASAQAPAVCAWVQDRRRDHPATEDFVLDAARFVQDQVRYVAIEVGVARRRPSDPSLVLRRRYGDCKDKSALLVAILRAAGIGAQPALVSTTHGESLPEFAPSPGLFDHVIVRVAPSGGAVYWIDPTVTLQGGSLARLERSPFSYALPLDQTTVNLEPLQPLRVTQPSPFVADRFAVALPESRRETQLDSERVYRGRWADLMRSLLRALSAEQAAKQFQSLYEKDYPTIHPTAPLEHSDDRGNNVLRVVAHYGIPGFWSWDEQDKKYRAVVIPRGLEQLLPGEPPADRSAPVALDFPLRARYVSELALPFDIAQSPEDVHVENATFEFRFKSETETKNLAYIYEFATRSASVRRGDFAAHRDALARVKPTLYRALTYFPDAPCAPNWLLMALFVPFTAAFGWAGYRMYRHIPEAAPSPFDPRIDPELARIGGWLILLGMNLVALPVRILYHFVLDAKVIFDAARWGAIANPGHPSYRPGLAAFVVSEAIANLWFIVQMSVVLVLFLGKRRTFPRQFTVAVVALVAVLAADVAVLPSVTTERSTKAGALVQTFIWAAIWVAYVHRSRRVAQTFVR